MCIRARCVLRGCRSYSYAPYYVLYRVNNLLQLNAKVNQSSGRIVNYSWNSSLDLCMRCSSMINDDGPIAWNPSVSGRVKFINTLAARTALDDRRSGRINKSTNHDCGKTDETDCWREMRQLLTKDICVVFCREATARNKTIVAEIARYMDWAIFCAQTPVRESITFFAEFCGIYYELLNFRRLIRPTAQFLLTPAVLISSRTKIRRPKRWKLQHVAGDKINGCVSKAVWSTCACDSLRPWRYINLLTYLLY